jgi:hypothetical protein
VKNEVNEMTGRTFQGKVLIKEALTSEGISSAELNVKGVITSTDLNVESNIFAGEVQADEIVAREIALKNTIGNSTTVEIDGEQANLKMGGKKADDSLGVDGDILLFSKDGDRSKDANATVHLDADESAVHLRDSEGNTTVYLWGKYGNLRVGGQKANGESGVDGDILLFSKDGDRSKDANATVHLDADESAVHLRDSEGNTTVYLWGEGADLKMGGKKANGQDGVAGQIWLFAKDGNRSNLNDATIAVDGSRSDISLRDTDGNTTVSLWGGGADLKMGGKKANGQDGVAGQIWLFAKDGNRSNLNDATIAIDGYTGNISLSNGDCAEDFDITVDGEVEPGTVMVIDEAGGLRPSTEGYDKKVAGVISGAGEFKPGMVLDRQPGKNNRMPIALMGKVYCKVDAQYGAIEIGDLLTTSATPGHAMKAS